MKHHHTPRGGRLISGMLVLVGMASPAFADPKVPRGVLDIEQSLVRVGAQSQMKWEIQYPKSVTDDVDIEVLKPKKDLKMRVRVLGSSFQKMKNNNGHGNNEDGVDSSNPGGGTKTDGTPNVDDETSGTVKVTGTLDLPVEVVWSKNGSTWERIFYGFQSEVVPTAVVLNTQLSKDDLVNFAGRGYQDGWLPLYATGTNTPNIVILKDGDPVPAFIPAFKLGQIKGYLKPYLSSDYKTFKLGESDIVILMELDESDPNKTGFDLQDLAVLVTFE